MPTSSVRFRARNGRRRLIPRPLAALNEYLAGLDDAAFGAASEVAPEFVSPNAGIQREFVNFPVRHAAAARVIADQRVVACKPMQDIPLNRALPIIFEVIEPVRRFGQRRGVTD